MSDINTYLYLVDEYGQTEWDIHYSLLLAGKSVIVSSLKYDGFLSEDIISPIQELVKESESTGSPLQLSKLPIPQGWDIVTRDGEVTLRDLYFTRARVKFEGDFSERIVKEIAWVSPKGELERIDYYNKKGFLYRMDTYSVFTGMLVSTRYFDYQGNIVASHDLTTNSVSSINGLFSTYDDFIINLLENMSDRSLITSSNSSLIESISNALFLPKGRESNYFIFSSEYVNKAPSWVLNILDKNDRKVIVTKSSTFRLLCDHKVQFSGVSVPIRDAKNDNHSVLIATLSDNIVDIDTLLDDCSGLKFHIFAPTFMSSKLKSLAYKYPNVFLHEAGTLDKLKKLVAECGILLDIAVSGEVFNVNRLAVEHGLLRVGLLSTCDMSYISRDFVFSEVSEFIPLLNTINKNKELLDASVLKEDAELGVNYKVCFDKLIK